MDRPFKKDNAKDKFAVEYVVPFLLERIRCEEGSKQIVDLATSMCVFPFTTEGGTRLGCLNEPGMSWYYAKDDEKTFSTKSYRLLDTRVLKTEVANSLKELLGRLNLISEYTEAVVINELVDRMSRETDYTATWWGCAFDVYGLWEQSKTRISLADATRSMKNDAFLFRDEYCPPKLRERLIRFGVFRDINDTVAKEHFWDRLPRNGESKARELLREMGVPTTFVVGSKINHRILDLATRISDSVNFDMSLGKHDRELCDLCHTLLFECIYKESFTTLQNIITSVDHRLLRGIPVLNAAGQYVPLAHDLFYADEDLPGGNTQKETSPFVHVMDEAQLMRKRRRPIAVTNSFEHLHIDAKKYGKDILNAIPSVHNFKEIDEPFSGYSLGTVGAGSSPASFYKWVWNHSQHERLARNILRHFSGNKHSQPTVREEDVKLVLDVMDELESGDSACSFVIVMGSEKAFDEASLLNRIPKSFPEVSVTVFGQFQGFDPHRYLEAVLEGAAVDYATKRSIRADRIWENSYLAAGNTDQFAGDYLLARVFEHQNRGPAIILWPSSDEDCYAIAIAEYIDSTYGTEIAGAITAEVDWREQYQGLVAGIRWFLNEHHETIHVEDTYGNTASLDDVRTYGDEKRIWQKLQYERDRYFAGSVPGHNASRAYLSSVYEGRCQLCGGRTAKGMQSSYYWTFRMVKEAENALANLPSNIFCLCPSCHGELQYGSLMGKDMSSLVDLAKEYSNHIQRAIDSGEFDDNFPSTVGELANDDIDIEGFYRPIVCDVVVNGDMRHMAFSWEHFMRLAFMFSDDGDDSSL